MVTHTSLKVTCIDRVTQTSLKVNSVDRVTQISLKLTYVDRVTQTSLRVISIDRVTQTSLRVTRIPDPSRRCAGTGSFFCDVTSSLTVFWMIRRLGEDKLAAC